mmetsp:Transcript_11347/g.36025  ORF Transcript_11347/g.36025 Transcript_11347/m.36025 type:complete len:162 (+) Transcript_11347:57-542(+)
MVQTLADFVGNLGNIEEVNWDSRCSRTLVRSASAPMLSSTECEYHGDSHSDCLSISSLLARSVDSHSAPPTRSPSAIERRRSLRRFLESRSGTGSSVNMSVRCEPDLSESGLPLPHTDIFDFVACGGAGMGEEPSRCEWDCRLLRALLLVLGCERRNASAV